MADAPADPTAKPRRMPRRRLLLLVGGGVLVVGAVLAFMPPFAFLLSHDEPAPAPVAVAPIVKREPATLGIEYHFDRNALVDTRVVGEDIVALSAAGNLIVFDGESFRVRREKVLHRRGTCLGPVEGTSVLVGLANGAVVRVAIADLSVRSAADVPGRPRWIGKKRDGAVLVAYESAFDGKLVLRDETVAQTFTLDDAPLLFLDSKNRLWSGSSRHVQILDLATGVRQELPWKDEWSGLRGFSELADGQVLAFGGQLEEGGAGERRSFIVRLAPGAKPSLLFPTKRRPASAPSLAIMRVLEDAERSGLIVVAGDGVSLTDPEFSSWRPLDAMVAGRSTEDAIAPVGQAHRVGSRVLLTLARGGFLEVTADFTRRHQVDGQYSVIRPSSIVRLTGGMAFYGDGGPLFYRDRGWHALPDPILPPAELMGPGRAGEKERAWAATTTIPIDADSSYVIAKAGPPRHYVGHLHGLRDVFVTARWDGKVLTVLGREELPIEPDDTFVTPDRQLWNVDYQGLWSFSAGRWHMVMRAAAVSDKQAEKLDSAEARSHTHFRSAIGEPLHFAESRRSPFYGLPSSAASWALVRLDSNEAGGVPLVDEVPVKVDRDRLLVLDVTIWGSIGEDLLLATDHGLCVFSVKWGNCSLVRPEGLRDEVHLFMRDGTKRLWLGGRGLWILRDRKQADPIHPWIPMLADTRVVALAEAPDGRLVIGTEDRGVVFLSIPQGWFQRPQTTSPLPAWDDVRAHEAIASDPGLVLRECPGAAGATAQAQTLAAGLRDLARAQGGRVRVEQEEVFAGAPDLVIRGPELKPLVDAVLPLLQKLDGKGRWGVLKRFGSRGADSVELRACPQ